MRAMLCRALLGLAAAAAAQEPEVVQLLQQKLALKGPQEQRLRAVEPLVWMHLPKCGSSFMNTLIQMPGFCPTANYTIDKRTGEFQLNNFNHQICPQHCDQRKLLCPEWDHLPPSNYSAEKGRLVGLFRQPEQRILSGFHDPGWRQWVPNQTLFEFAEQWKGGMAYQLTEPQDSYVFWPQDRSGVRTLEDGEEAARRVREGFAFVGITEEWDLSICLFHKMFGGPCHASEFVDSRPGPEKNSSNQTATTPYDQEVLNGWRDDVDAVVYAAAQDVFHQNLALYDVTHDSCQACYGAE